MSQGGQWKRCEWENDLYKKSMEGMNKKKEELGGTRKRKQDRKGEHG